MEEDDIDLILIEIIKEFTKEENFPILDSQKLGSSIFFSFAQGVLKNDEDNDDKINNLIYCTQWLREHDKLLENFNSNTGDKNV